MNIKAKRLASCFIKTIIPLLSFLALWAGAMVYIYLRSAEPLFIQWLETAGFQKIFSVSNDFFIHLKLPDWLLYTLPSGLWAFAYSILITGIWWNSQSWIKYIWFVSILLLVIGWELSQLTGIISGVSSLGDIFAGLLGAVIGIITGIKIIKPKNYEKETH